MQELRRKIYIKAKSEPLWKFWGLYVHICKMETLLEAYKLAKQNKGAPGIDGVTFEMIEANGKEQYLQEIQTDLTNKTYRPQRNKQVEIPKAKGKTRKLGIPTIRDRIVQGAVKLIIEPIFEADFQDGSYGYRPKRKAADAIKRVSKAAVTGKTIIVDLDLKSYFDTVRHDILLKKIAARIQDPNVLRLIKLILKSSGKKGVPQGGVLSPLLSNLYLNDIDKILEKAKKVTSRNGYAKLEYARWADDLIVLIDRHRRSFWLEKAVRKRLHEELTKLALTINQEKSSVIDLYKPKSYFEFLGFRFKRVISHKRKPWIQSTPKPAAVQKLRTKIKETFRCNRMRSINETVQKVNPMLRGWVNYFRIGNSGQCFSKLREWVEKKVRRHVRKAQQKEGFGWKKWSTKQVYSRTGLFNDYKIRYA